MSKKVRFATAFAILAAALYAINIPFSKELLSFAEPTMMAAFLYLGAGLGLFIFGGIQKLLSPGETARPLSKKELPFTLLMVLLDIAAPILLMFGIKYSSASNVSLINNFEIVATSLIALFIFKEKISKKLWFAIGLVTLASIILSFEKKGMLEFNLGSLFVLGACLCWGLENNCTRQLSDKSAVEIVVIKGTFSGLGSLIVALIIGESLPTVSRVFVILLLGFVSYGLSILFYIKAQSVLGAAKTSAFYSVAPFLGVLFAMTIFGEAPAVQFYFALAIMIAATVIMIRDTINS